MKYQSILAENIRKILIAKGMDQVDLVDEDIIKESVLSKTLNCKRKMSVDDLSEIARALGVREIDIITWPDIYDAPEREKEQEQEPVEAVLQIKLKKDKKDQVLKLIFGENNIEILNK